jgi:hypothetical protein
MADITSRRLVKLYKEHISDVSSLATAFFLEHLSPVLVGSAVL